MEKQIQSVQSAFEMARKKYCVVFSTNLGYSIATNKQGRGMIDYEVFAEISGIKPEKVISAYKNKEYGAILVRKDGVELFTKNSKLEDVLISMISEEDSEEVARNIIAQSRVPEKKIPLIAVHKHGNSNTKLRLVNMTLGGGRFTEYSHVTSLPLYGSFARMIIDLYTKKQIREDDYVRFIASFGSEIPNWIPEITPREDYKF